MLQLVSGAPGCGKTYLAVNYLFGFCRYDKLYEEFILDSHVLVITNIEGLKIKHWTLNHCLNLSPYDKLSNATPERVEEFFSIRNFEKIQATTKKSHVILLIDEAHELFPAGFKSPPIYEFFAYHRHIGLDVFLLTQGIESMSRMFNPLIEYIVKGVPRSKKVLGGFSYKVVDIKGLPLYPKKISTQPLVFKMYTSFRVDEKNKPKSAYRMWIMFFIVVVLGAGFMFRTAYTSLLGKSESASVVVGPSLSVAEMRAKSGYVAPLPLIPPVVSSVPVVVVPVVSPWKHYSVDGYYEVEGKGLYYLINGRSFKHTGVFRNFDDDNLTVECLTFIAERRKRKQSVGSSRAMASLAPLDLGGAFPDKVDPLGERGLD